MYTEALIDGGVSIIHNGEKISISEVLKKLNDLELAEVEAKNLATILYKKYYREDAPNWELSDSVAGIISQIDNMTTGLTKIKEDEKPKPCPICQGLDINCEEGEFGDFSFIECLDCNLHLEGKTDHETVQQLIRRWNGRVRSK